LRFSGTPVSYRHPPPVLGEHTDDVLRDVLDLDDVELALLKETGII
jgi:crotonobetainyl-CoA:carnitine CoA-transferase CaiB-like acyl-CoA transferase